MLFDVQAALAEILNEPARHCDSRDSCDSEPSKSQDSRESQSQAPANICDEALSPHPMDAPISPSHPAYPPGAIIHLSRYRPSVDRDGRPVRVLPTHPATCAICGEADWLVGMTDRQGRTLHVRCWKAEGGEA